MDDAAVARLLADRGGRHQQAALVRLLDDDPMARSCFADALTNLFGWGALSLPNVQWLASCVKRDYAARPEGHPDIDALAAIGASGEYPGNMRRDLLRWIIYYSFSIS